MLKLIMTSAVIALTASASFAQGSNSSSASNSGAASQSQAQAQAQTASSSSLTQINNSDGEQRIVYSGDYDLNNVPAVTAPAVFGGGHPCLAGASGGIAVAGFGGSYGQGTAETVCMLYVMGQPEAAIRALVMSDPVACRALNNVGYYRVGGSVVPFKCGETVTGGIDTAGVSSKKSIVTASTKSEPTLKDYGLRKCEKAAGNKVVVSYRPGVDKALAKDNCLKILGY